MSSIMRKSVDKVNSKDIPADEAVLELVHTVMHQFRSQQYRALEGAQDGLTHMEGKVLGFFARHAGATQSELAQHSGRDKAQLARLIKGLRERGLLSAEADDADRRNVRLQLTDEGQAMLRTLRLQGRKLEARAVEGLSADQRQRLIELLLRVKRNLET
jgi:DNA-binding MarR family transcriptional regulator